MLKKKSKKCSNCKKITCICIKKLTKKSTNKSTKKITKKTTNKPTKKLINKLINKSKNKNNYKSVKNNNSEIGFISGYSYG